MSALPSPLKSPESITCHDVPGFDPTAPLASTLSPSISQPPAWPLSFCHRMSDLPSPLKSPAAITVQLVDHCAGVPTGLCATTVVPSISQMPGAAPCPVAEFASACCHRM